MQKLLRFTITREAGAYTAEGVNAPIVTCGATFEELARDIREAVELFVEAEEPGAILSAHRVKPKLPIIAF